jgi:hypothetical protein
MLKYNTYFYYVKSDNSQESIDKVLAYDWDGALEYFSERKKMDKLTFLQLYTIKENGSK